VSQTNQFLISHGLPIVFLAVFLDQMGVPIPAVPWLLAAGALAAAGKFHWFMALDLSILACLIADLFWFYLGRYRGTQVLGLLCRLSLEPDSCVRKTVNLFTRYGMRGIVGAKFVPGMATITPPLAGMSGVSVGQFLAYDSLGSLLYSGSFILLGYIFSNQIAQIATAFSNIGGGLLTVIVAVVVLYIAYKYWERRRLLNELRMAKITPGELGQMLEAGQIPLILDVRSVIELEQEPAIIRGAIHLAMDELDKRQHEFPRDREIIIYCDCPNEESSAKTALILRKKGFTRVRPLLGGIAAWREGNYPTEMWTKTTATVTTSIVVSEPATAATPKKAKSSPHR
jgi:membrane protein DedA with SNARE-associated domain/rhodanese-related sulfurtransferase